MHNLQTIKERTKRKEKVKALLKAML